jgi:polar amino acid transport system ATP-binding protein
MSVLEAIGLAKSFDGRTIFEDVSLQLGVGETLALMGPSGAGKSTLLRCLAGLELASRGSVVARDARIVAGDPPQQMQLAIRALRTHVGFVFQGAHLFSHRTLLENVMEGPVYVKKEPATKARERAMRLLDKVGVANRAQAYPRELSGGEQQRGAIARALALEPEILLLDEPTSALDPDRGERLAELLVDLVREGLAALTVTHDDRFATALGARVLRLEHGRVV